VCLFSVKKRNDKLVCGKTENQFEFLDRSSIPGVEKVRELVENCFSYWPEDNKLEIKKRLKDKNPKSFHCALFELFIYAVLKKLGYEVIINDCKNSKGKVADFAASHKEKNEEIVIEATVSFSKKTNITHFKSLFNKIDKKNSQKQDDNRPYVIAINISDDNYLHFDYDMLASLYGKLSLGQYVNANSEEDKRFNITFEPYESSSDTEVISPISPIFQHNKYTSISAVLAFFNFSLPQLTSEAFSKLFNAESNCAVRLYHNPFAKNKLQDSSCLRRFPQASLESQVNFVKGATIESIMKIPKVDLI
jgi:recombinational DNA repair protein (RecF pathway)